MSGYVTVTLTRAQARALHMAANYCQAGGPDDWGNEADAEGYRLQATLDRANDRLAAAMQAQPRKRGGTMPRPLTP